MSTYFCISHTLITSWYDDLLICIPLSKNTVTFNQEQRAQKLTQVGKIEEKIMRNFYILAKRGRREQKLYIYIKKNIPQK